MEDLKDKIHIINAKIDLIIRKLNQHQETIEIDCPECDGERLIQRYLPASFRYVMEGCNNCNGSGKIRAVDLKLEG